MVYSNDIDNLERKLKEMADSLYDLPKESLDLLWRAVEEAELVQLLNRVNLEEYDGLMNVTPIKNVKQRASFPINHGKRWTREEVAELDALLKMPDVRLDQIAHRFGRSKKSIDYKAASIVDQKKRSGYILERALADYHGKVGHDIYELYVDRKNQDLFEARKRRKNFYRKIQYDRYYRLLSRI